MCLILGDIMGQICQSDFYIKGLSSFQETPCLVRDDEIDVFLLRINETMLVNKGIWLIFCPYFKALVCIMVGMGRYLSFFISKVTVVDLAA